MKDASNIPTVWESVTLKVIYSMLGGDWWKWLIEREPVGPRIEL